MKGMDGNAENRVDKNKAKKGNAITVVKLADRSNTSGIASRVRGKDVTATRRKARDDGSVSKLSNGRKQRISKDLQPKTQRVDTQEMMPDRADQTSMSRPVFIDELYRYMAVAAAAAIIWPVNKYIAMGMLAGYLVRASSNSHA